MRTWARALVATPSVLGWSRRAVGAVRRQLPEPHALDRVQVPPPPGGCAAVPLIVLRFGCRSVRATCLERCLVLQAWEAVRGRQRAVVIGVKRTGGRTVAHAWLDGDPVRRHYVELTRVLR